MSILELVAEKHLGLDTLRKHPQLLASLKSMDHSSMPDGERERLAAIIELCFEFTRETDPEEQENILRTLEEISSNAPVEMPVESLEEWNVRLIQNDRAYAKADATAGKKSDDFLGKYFTFRSRAGLATQADVARAAGLSRSYVAVIESGEHIPQQKTLQKLSKAFGIEIAELLP